MGLVKRFFWFDFSFDTTCDRILYDALEGKKVARADWADPANRCESYGGGMYETFESRGRRDLEEQVEEDDCKIKSADRYKFHQDWCRGEYGENPSRGGSWMY